MDEADVTTTSCSTVVLRPLPSVTVRRTNFVPTSTNVKTSVVPFPSGQSVPPGPSGPSSSQTYVQGWVLQPPLAWNVTA